jgi:Rrf2 family transcriptional regulator, nitric oxide-sensitive transcriptional repressor
MRLTVFTDYSLRVLLMLAKQRDSILTIGEVAAYFRISEAHLMKVTHTLGRSGWVETVRGRNGGMRLTADPDALRLDAIIAYLEGSFELAECFGPGNTCRLTGACGLETALSGAADAFRAILKQHTLGSLARATPMKPAAPSVVAMPVKSRIKTTS